MLNLSQYRVLAILSENANTIVYRALEQTEGTPVVLKTIRKNYPSTVDIARLKHEYDIARNLNITGAVTPYGLDELQEKPILVLEDFGGRDIAYWLHSGELSVECVLWIGEQLAETLGHLHQKRVIHKDIKPENIIFNPETQELKLTDFSISSRLSKEAATISGPNLLEGTLTHISPEQTGRMNRAIDYRTDFYSLGVTLYELLAGQPPFQSDDPMELIHCHIAKTPKPLHTVNRKIPEILSALVAKLMAKTAEDRYQSAYGIKADLEICCQQWRESQTVRPFMLAQQDRRGTFSIPQKLYGRESEVQQLLAAFDRVGQGRTEMMLVAGYSGIGKSALVNEVHKPIVQQRGYFISGKFDQFQRNKPYSSLIQAFRELVRQLLTETEIQVASWREKLTTALGKNGQAIVDVIPEVESIVGPQPALPVLSSSEAQNRFNRVFQEFIRVFTRKEHPLVMFLDDLQWADAASLQLIQLLVADPDGQYLLMLGAYRDNEVSPTHPLIRTLSNIQEMGTTLETIVLKPLNLAHITELVGDTLHMKRSEIETLTQLLVQKTRGNPFFLTQLFKYLYLEEVIQFNIPTAQWQWNAKDLLEIKITDNVVYLMVGEIQKLPRSTQNVLQLAACVGNRFDLRILAIVNDKPAKMVAADLWDALQSGLVVPLSDAYKIPQVVEDCEALQIDYKFLHDRVQQAAYSLIPEAEKQQVHLKVGRLLWQSIPPEQLDERIFDIVNPLNIGSALIVEPTERLDLARLNLQAGRKAKTATAYDSEIEYLTAGRNLLPEDAWQTEYDLTLQLYTEVVEVEYLLTHFEIAQSLSEIVLKRTRTLLDKVKIYEVKIQFFIAQNQMLEAIETALPVLELLGYPLETDPAKLQLVRPLPQLDELADYPEMRSPQQLAVLQILAIITGPAYQARPDLLPFVVSGMVNLCLEFGHSSLAAYAYGMHGLMLCGPLNDVALGYQSGKISMHILEQYPSDALKCKVHMLFNSFVGHWKEAHHRTIKTLEQTANMGLETGDVVYAAYCAMWSCGYMMLTGMTIPDVEAAQQIYVELLAKTKQEHGWYPAKTWRQLTQNLRGEAADASNLDGEYLSRREVEHLEAVQNQMLLFFVYFAEVILAYLMKDWQTAKGKIALASQYQAAATASMLFGGYVFYETLVQLAIYSNLSLEDRQTTWEAIQANTDRIASWASYAPHNYQSKYELVLAEQARIQGQVLEAMDYYDRAISTAQANGFLAETGIAAERASEFYQSLGREKIAQHYLLDAIYGYERWGALAKVVALQEDCPTLHNSSPFHDVTLAEITGSYGQILDLSTVLKAAEAIAREIVLSQLLAQLIKVLLENTGAQLGFLILETEGELLIEAEAWANGETEVLQSMPLEFVKPDGSLPLLCSAIVNYVARTQESVVLNDARNEGNFTTQTYIQNFQVKSVLCVPLVEQGQLRGLVYLENNLTTGAFTQERVQIVQLLSGQAAIAISNAQLYTEVKQSEQRLQQFLEAIPIGVSVHAATGQLHYANRTAQQLLGINIAPEAKTEQLAEAYQIYRAGTQELYPNDRLPLVRSLAGETVKTDDLELRQPDKTLPLEVSSKPILDETGKVIYGILAFQDITERKQAEKLLVDYNKSLEKQLALSLENTQLYEASKRFVPAEFLSLLEKKSIIDVELGNQVEREMTVLFSDIRDFTTISEQMTPAENFAFINEYLGYMEPLIQAHGGFIDKYIGDAIMALFPNEADDAVKGSLSMLQELKKYNQVRQKSNLKPLRIGIGLHAGRLMLGTVGGSGRMDGTAIGDAVNLSSRVEGLTKNYGVSLLITHQTLARLHSPFNYDLRFIAQVKAKGKAKAVGLFEVFSADPPELRQAKIATKEKFERGVLLYHGGSFPEAARLFQECLEYNEGDRAARSYLDRCQDRIS